MGIPLSDETNYAQSLMHMLKGNLGAGILAMPATFAHCGLYNAMIGLPILCFIATYCAHLLIKSSKHLENKMIWEKMDYGELAEGAFKTGPWWMRACSGAMSVLTNAILLICQIGIGCVYLVFIVDNLHHIATTYTHSSISKNYFFVAIFPIILWLSCIKTLKRLAIASTIANFLQVFGILIILQHLIREMPDEVHTNKNKPFSEMALGFGSAVFAFEGISVLLPIYIRMKQPQSMDKYCGVINIAYGSLLVLYFLFGTLGYMKYGEEAKGSITLNLPNKPLFEMYVPAEIVWNWFVSKFSIDFAQTSPTRARVYQCLSRTVLVLLTFAMAMSVPNLNLIMDLFGSISGAALSIVLPPIIHLSTFWEDTPCSKRISLVLSSLLIVAVGLMLSLTGTYYSSMSIFATFGDSV